MPTVIDDLILVDYGAGRTRATVIYGADIEAGGPWNPLAHPVWDANFVNTVLDATNSRTIVLDESALAVGGTVEALQRADGSAGLLFAAESNEGTINPTTTELDLRNNLDTVEFDSKIFYVDGATSDVLATDGITSEVFEIPNHIGSPEQPTVAGRAPLGNRAESR